MPLRSSSTRRSNPPNTGRHPWSRLTARLNAAWRWARDGFERPALDPPEYDERADEDCAAVGADDCEVPLLAAG
jgi:hypothetical protein